ncbi:MarR family transcriptional regulator [Actinokineospora auranticolor]|uniref:DNA-binding MarR family transcriptional regulator n=1 Tax=Actinokineospora auranticolor TaxID=155976 RepID=A0A2S6GJH1_9PSEU|nr:MarR family transcriptional regulator [Actinokineospora auranticolor]PPK65369.1 DNA-binding MarR family transcriptional regulator [Actinokineospora auranticolor]
MIATETATGLIDALRAILRLGRTIHHNHPDESQSAVAVLTLLDRAGEQRLGRVACLLAVDPSVISRQVTLLTRDGLVARRPDPHDGRAWLLSLTDAGQARLAELQRRHAELLVTALRTWSEDDATALLTALRRLTDDVHRAHTP